MFQFAAKLGTDEGCNGTDPVTGDHLHDTEDAPCAPHPKLVCGT